MHYAVVERQPGSHPAAHKRHSIWTILASVVQAERQTVLVCMSVVRMQSRQRHLVSMWPAGHRPQVVPFADYTAVVWACTDTLPVCMSAEAAGRNAQEEAVTDMTASGRKSTQIQLT